MTEENKEDEGQENRRPEWLDIGDRKITTPLGAFSKKKFNALIKVREAALEGFRNGLKRRGYSEVTTSSLVNISGSCENPNASFSVNYYGKDAHLSQSAQLQLESLVLRLRRGFFTVNNSFREEHFDDPEAAGRRLSEFTLIEPERPLVAECWSLPENALNWLVEEQDTVFRNAVEHVLESAGKELVYLGGDVKYLKSLDVARFDRIRYSDALQLLREEGIDLEFGSDLGIKEERAILRYFKNIPTFVTGHPASLKFFNAARTPSGIAYSVDLLTPSLGETIGGAVREKDGNKVRKYLLESKVSQYLSERGQDPEQVFGEYLRIFEQERPLLRGGYGIGFERFVAFLLGSNDILDTIVYRSLQPTGGST